MIQNHEFFYKVKLNLSILSMMKNLISTVLSVCFIYLSNLYAEESYSREQKVILLVSTSQSQEIPGSSPAFGRPCPHPQFPTFLIINYVCKIKFSYFQLFLELKSYRSLISFLHSPILLLIFRNHTVRKSNTFFNLQGINNR